MSRTVTNERFRRDRWLRSSGYGLVSWGMVHALLTVPWWKAHDGAPWPRTVVLAYSLSILATGVLLSVVNHNRVAKMCGPAGKAIVDAGRLWGAVLFLGGAGSAIVWAYGSMVPLPSAWMLVLGTGFLLWGRFTVSELRWLGVLLLTGGVGTAMASPVLSPPGMLFSWLLFTSALWLPLGVRINRKYLYVRPSPVADERTRHGRTGDSPEPSSRSCASRDT